uniref:Uncharacterized protein n=1 Tax=Arundo donax TaxID=35708 RepID=A0A0A8YUK4_ARUDO
MMVILTHLHMAKALLLSNQTHAIQQLELES